MKPTAAMLPLFSSIAASGLADPEKGRSIRRALRSLLDEFDQKIPDPVRTECARLAGQALAVAYGVGNGEIEPKKSV